MLKNLLTIAAGAAVLFAVLSSQTPSRARQRAGSRSIGYGNNAGRTRVQPPSYPPGFRSLSLWNSDTKH